MADRSIPLPLKLLVQYALTLLVLWAMTRTLPDYLVIQGSWAALPTVAALVMLLNIFARPILKILTFPLKLFMTIAAVILANGLFLWILEKIADRFDPNVALVMVGGGIGGWLVVALLLGLSNWVLHHIVKE